MTVDIPVAGGDPAACSTDAVKAGCSISRTNSSACWYEWSTGEWNVISQLEEVDSQPPKGKLGDLVEEVEGLASILLLGRLGFAPSPA